MSKVLYWSNQHRGAAHKPDGKVLDFSSNIHNSSQLRNWDPVFFPGTITLKNWLLLSPGHLSYWKQNQNCLKTSYIQVFGPVERRFDTFGRLHCQQPSLSTLWCPLSKGQYLFLGDFANIFVQFNTIWWNLRPFNFRAVSNPVWSQKPPRRARKAAKTMSTLWTRWCWWCSPSLPWSSSFLFLLSAPLLLSGLASAQTF